MPYIASRERPDIDKKVDSLARKLASDLARKNGDTDISTCYKGAIAAVTRTIKLLDSGRKPGSKTEEERLAVEVFSNGSKDRTAWLGRLNYAITTLIQKVPKEMVSNGAWEEEFRYWVYAQTVGSLERAALAADRSGPGPVTDGVVGVLIDVKDEYKRRVNSAYEAVQIRKSGDCYATPYRTQLTEVRDARGKIAGYQEVMKDLRS